MKSLLTVGVQDLKISCIIGTLPHEREHLQQIAIDISIEKEVVRIAEDLNETLDYCILAEICQKFAKKNYLLLETLAEDILEILIKEMNVRHAKITIRKKSAIPEAEYAYISLERGKKG